MQCNRLNHFIKIETGTKPLVRCCHMANPPRFSSLTELENSSWLKDVNEKFNLDEWPDECIRCKQAEDAGIESVRIISNRTHQDFVKVNKDYLVVDVISDAVCNAACPICSEDLSSTIAKLKKIPINPFNGIDILNTIPKDRIVQLDILGGEPGASKNSKRLLSQLKDFTNLQSIHLSTNGSMKIPEIEKLLKKNIKVDLVVSMDGTASVFEYCRFPIQWEKFVSNMQYYKELQSKYPHLSILLWSAISAICVADLPNVLKFSEDIGIPFNGAPLQFPVDLSISKTNFLTLKAKEICSNSEHEFCQKMSSLIAVDNYDNSLELRSFLSSSDSLRKINFKNYINV